MQINDTGKQWNAMITTNQENAGLKCSPPADGLAAEDAPTEALRAISPESPGIHLANQARTIAPAILATIGCVFALQWAQDFFIPLILSILASYTLTPVVAGLERIKVPRIIGTTLVLITLLCGVAVIADTLRTEFQSILERLPAAAHQISRAITKVQDGQPGTMQRMQAAATEIEQATNQAAGDRPVSRQAAASAALVRPSFKIREWLWAGSMGAAQFVGQLTMIIFLIFFLLLSGDSFKRKLVKISGPTLSSKKITVHILEDINKSIQSYMFMLLVTNMLLALLLWLVFRWVGLENAGAWAVAAGCLHIIPYFGPLVIAVATGVTAFMQFGSMSKTLLVSGSSLAVALLVGMVITTWMTGRIAKMNAAAVFIGLLFWGWLWGIWGMLLGIPIIVMVRVIAEHVEGMQAVAEMLSE